MIHFKWYKFSELSVDQLYDLLALRFEVFFIEQHCFDLDPDGKDKFALHLLGQKDSLVAYMRVFPPTDAEKFIKFGRVVTAKSERGKGYGKDLMHELLTYCHINYPGTVIKCSAQLYLKKFYEDFGFNAVGDIYDEAGIPHIIMQKG